MIVTFSFLIAVQKTHAEGVVVINEFLVDPDADQWVELYNPGDSIIDIGGWFIDDNGGTQKYTIPTGTTINPQEFKTFESSSFNLNKTSEDELRLLNGSSVIDSYQYSTGPGANYTYGRNGDGTGSWAVFNNPTKGSSNNSSNPLPIPTTTQPTPTRTPTPTKAPTPTKIPTPTKTPTAAKSTITITPTKSSSILSAVSKAAISKLATARKSSTSGIPTSILGTNSAEKKSSVSAKTKNKKTIVKSANQNMLIPAAFVIGSILLLTSGGFYFRKIRNDRKHST